MKIYELKRGDKFKLEGGVGKEWTFIGPSTAPPDQYYLAYDRTGKLQYFPTYIEVVKIE